MFLLEDCPGYVRLVREAFKLAEPAVELHVSLSWRDGREFLSDRADDESAAYPDALLLDVGLPQTDGHSVLTEVREAPELPHRPTFVLASSLDEADIRRSYEHHATACIEKPDDFDDLVSVAQSITTF